jgi:hypothetical protein
MKFLQFRRLFILLTVIAISASTALAEKPESAKIRVNVTPSEAYIFIDGQAYTHRSHTLRLAPGEYTIGGLQLRLYAAGPEAHLERG